MTPRKRMLNGEISHHDYYVGIAKQVGLRPDPSLMKKVRRSKDQHYNDIPLQVWDAWARAYMKLGLGISRAFIERGDFVTDAGLVSLLKVACRQKILEESET